MVRGTDVKSQGFIHVKVATKNVKSFKSQPQEQIEFRDNPFKRLIWVKIGFFEINENLVT